LKRPEGKVRYAVVGLGYISQVAVLPAFAHAKSKETLIKFSLCTASILKSRQHEAEDTGDDERL
jgi:predicted dehydrogenase